MTIEEEQALYRILFEDSDEDCPAAIYEIYDTVDELIQNRKYLPQSAPVLH